MYRFVDGNMLHCFVLYDKIAGNESYVVQSAKFHNGHAIEGCPESHAACVSVQPLAGTNHYHSTLHSIANGCCKQWDGKYSWCIVAF